MYKGLLRHTYIYAPFSLILCKQCIYAKVSANKTLTANSVEWQKYLSSVICSIETCKVHFGLWMYPREVINRPHVVAWSGRTQLTVYTFVDFLCCLIPHEKSRDFHYFHINFLFLTFSYISWRPWHGIWGSILLTRHLYRFL